MTNNIKAEYLQILLWLRDLNHRIYWKFWEKKIHPFLFAARKYRNSSTRMWVPVCTSMCVCVCVEYSLQQYKATLSKPQFVINSEWLWHAVISGSILLFLRIIFMRKWQLTINLVNYTLLECKIPKTKRTWTRLRTRHASLCHNWSAEG